MPTSPASQTRTAILKIKAPHLFHSRVIRHQRRFPHNPRRRSPLIVLMDTSDHTSSSFGATEEQPFVWDQNSEDSFSDSSEDLPPAHAYLDEISVPINEELTPSMISTGSYEQSMVNIPLPRSPRSDHNSFDHSASSAFQGSLEMSLDSPLGNTILPPELSSRGHGASEPAKANLDSPSAIANTSVGFLPPLPTSRDTTFSSSPTSVNNSLPAGGNISNNTSGQISFSNIPPLPPSNTSFNISSTNISFDSLPPLPSSGNTSYNSSVGAWSGNMDLTSVVAPGQVHAPDTSGSLQNSEHNTHSAPGSPLSSQSNNVPSPTKSTKSRSYSGLSKGSGAEVRPSSRSSTSSGRRSNSRQSENGDTRRRVSSPSWHGSEILASSGSVWKENQELREKLAKLGAMNDALQKDVQRLEKSAQDERTRAEREIKFARKALEKAETKVERAEAAAEQERKWARDAVAKAESKVERAEATAEQERKWAREAMTKADTKIERAMDKAEASAKEKEEYKIRALVAETEAKDLKLKLKKYESEAK